MAEAEKKFETLGEALGHWVGRNTDPLWIALKPPVNVTGHEVPDAMLALTFRRMAERSLTEDRLDILQRAMDSEEGFISGMRSIFPGVNYDSHILDVLRKWYLELNQRPH